MKNVWRILLVFAAFAMGTIAATAQAAQVQITNSAGEKRKLCVYDADDQIGIVPKKCFEMNSNERLFWNREGNPNGFKVKIFKPGLIDDYLYTRDLPGDTKRILMGVGKRFGYSREEAKPDAVKYRLRVCNQQYDERVYFVLGFETNKGRFTEGWWNVGKGQCLDFPVSENLRRKIGLEYGNLPRTYYFAQTFGSNPLHWQGGNDGNWLCATESEAFNRLSKRNSNGSYDTRCDDAGYKNFSFRRLDDPKTNEEWYYLTF